MDWPFHDVRGRTGVRQTTGFHCHAGTEDGVESPILLRVPENLKKNLRRIASRARPGTCRPRTSLPGTGTMHRPRRF